MTDGRLSEVTGEDGWGAVLPSAFEFEQHESLDMREALALPIPAWVFILIEILNKVGGILTELADKTN